jgi:hypothetical protein
MTSADADGYMVYVHPKVVQRDLLPSVRGGRSWVIGTVTVTEKGLAVVAPSCLVPLTQTVVIPIGKNEPEGGSLVTTPQLPVKVGAG